MSRLSLPGRRPGSSAGSASGPGLLGSPARANGFGLLEAVLGLVAGFILTMIAVATYAAVTHHPHHPSRYGEDVVGLVALWIGFVGAAIVATRTPVHESAVPGVPVEGDAEPARPRGSGREVTDYGISLRPWPDIPLGIVAGVASQYLLVPLLELPLLPFVPHLFSRLSHPAQSLTGDVFGPGLVVLSVLVCVGSPVVEELFFRGLLLRALLGRFEGLGRRLAPAAAIVVTALVFALVHFEALQFLGLAGFGVVLGCLAWRTGRLGPSIVAHMAFNTVTIVALVVGR